MIIGVGATMDIDQETPISSLAGMENLTDRTRQPLGRSDISSKPWQEGHHMSAQILQGWLKDAERKYQEKMMAHCRSLLSQNRGQIYHINSLEGQLKSASECKRDMIENLSRLEHAYINLQQQHDDMKHKYAKKVQSYKELDKNYMDLVRPLQVTADDPSTIYRRLMYIRLSIETLVQKAKGDRSTNMKKEAAIEHFRESKLLQDFPVEEARLDSYHLNLYMESAIMMTLVDRLFKRPLGCIINQGELFEGIISWVESRDSKVATRWKQQLCILISQDDNAMACRREEEVNQATMELSNLISQVYPNVDMSVKIKDLCYNTFDLSYAMFGMESAIYPVSLALGTPFDDKTMTTPQKSNPTGLVSLVIFPAFQDNHKIFHIEPKVWCY